MGNHLFDVHLWSVFLFLNNVIISQSCIGACPFTQDIWYPPTRNWCLTTGTYLVFFLVPMGTELIWTFFTTTTKRHLCSFFGSCLKWGFHNHFVSACIVNLTVRRSAFMWICYKVFWLLNGQNTGRDGDSNPLRQNEDCYQSMLLPPSHHGWMVQKSFNGLSNESNTSSMYVLSK